MFLYIETRERKEKTIEHLTSLVKTKEGKLIQHQSQLQCPYFTYYISDIFFLILYKAIEKKILSVSAERQKELETLQEIITSLTLQVRERDQQIEELKQSLKGNWY